jgi:hydrogenase maturation protein HypF
MAEHGLAGPVIALTLDGNGYGPDHTVWGGEVLLADYHTFERLAHLSTVAMPGGDAAIREPWRMAFSHLYGAFGPGYKELNLQVLHDHRDTVDIMQQMIDRSINSPLTSSCGRLFDSVAALLGLRHTVSFEGQAAAELEMLLEPNDRDTATYPFTIVKSDANPWLLPVKPIITAIVHDILGNKNPHRISRRFHNTLAEIFTRVCLGIRDQRKQLKTNLAALSFAVYSHEQVPTNDGGIALGQALAGRAMFEKRKG